MTFEMTCKSYLASTQIKNLNYARYKWWSNHIYHFSDIQNIADILNCGHLYSRNKLKELNIVNNDIASAEVLNGTTDTRKDFVRFYFRPLTPTQYHNEGIYSRKQLSQNPLAAHCPVPVFLFFDTSILDEDYTYFTEESLASHKNIEIYNTLADLKKLPFDLIYHNTGITRENRAMIIKHRHAEVLIKDSYNLSHLTAIVCRNENEVTTLRHSLNFEALEKYGEIIHHPNDQFYTTIFNSKNKCLQVEKVNLNHKKERYEFDFNIKNNEKFHLKIVIEDYNGKILRFYETPKFVVNSQRFYYQIPNFEHLKSQNEMVSIKLLLDDNIVSFRVFGLD